MVFGFGFNRTKVLASAERNVKQGKLQNAISDYEKLLADDPKDLTVMNTVGDLYARVGNTEKATEFFRKIGDSYAGEGFTVRAIAMYKKLTKQNPEAHDAVLKLGDLYTQQGLYNDARAQYMQVAEHHLRSNRLPDAATVFQKTLELDPENSSLQTRLAELYIKIGRASDARDLYFRNAEALRTRGALDLADDALGRVISLDPNFGPALLMQGQVKFDSGDAEGAIKVLEQLPDLDSHPEGLRTLLKANLSLGKLENSEPIARKLLQVFNDPSGIAGHGEALMAAGAHQKALDFFAEHAAVLLASNQPAFMQSLQALTARVKSDPKALEKLAEIFQRAGNAGLIVEVTELLAHACVQQGNLVKARDLYQKLTQLEPENPQHAQNYRQIASKLADSPLPQTVEEHHESSPVPQAETPADASAAEDAQPVSQVEQKYPGDLAELIEAALTDSELFDSYNLSSKAIAPLEALLPRVANDVRVNQRLASLYARCGRLREAAERCTVLEKIHAVAGFLKDSRFYADLGAKYRQRAGLPREPEAKVGQVAPAPVAPMPVAPDAPAVRTPVPAQQPSAPPAPEPRRPAPAETRVPPPVESRSHEIDLSSEWEQMLEVEHPPAPSVAPPTSPMSAQPQVTAPMPAISPEEPEASSWDVSDEESNPLAELLDEVRFYISQRMWPEARAALARCESIEPSNPEVLQLSAQLAQHDSKHVVERSPSSAAPEPSGVDPLLMSNAVEVEIEPASEPATPVFAPLQPPYEPTRSPSVPEPGLEPTAQLPPEEPRPETIEPPTPRVVRFEEQLSSKPPVIPPVPAPVSVLDSFVHDLEASLGDFSLEPPTGGTEARNEVVSAVPVTAPEESAKTEEPVAVAPPIHAEPAPAPVVAPVPPVPANEGVTSAASDTDPAITQDEERNALTDIFAEFKESMESESDTKEEPETHYNLGIAFKEMDLLDEAIGEFQKVCQAIEQGYEFSETVQAYTWLADCFLKKGVPDLAVRWYERALKTPHVDYETDTAIRYELACACIAAGDREAALNHFMEVYGVNIDYRDVAERIKTLRS